MKKLLALCAGMMLFASVGMAQTNGLQVAWNNCQNQASSSPSVTFDCDPLAGTIYSEYYTFSLAAATPNVIAMDNIIDFIFPDRPARVPAFWQFQQGGCNNAGVNISQVKAVGTCGNAAANSVQLCGTGGTGCPAAVITSYIFGTSAGFAPDRGRMLITIARSAATPANLTAARHYAFVLNYFMDLADPATGCEGCLASVGKTWNSAVLYNTSSSTGGEANAAVLSSTDPGSTPSTGVNCTSCVTVGSKSKTWGQLKSLYR